MLGRITRYRIAAYIIDVVGIILVGIYGAGHSAKIASTYHAPVTFLYLGIALIVSGSALVFYDMKKTAKSKSKQRGESN